MHLCLSHSPSPQRLLGSGPVELRPQSSFHSCLVRRHEPQRPKKRVVFADTKGLSLTSVHKFEDAVGRDSEEGSCPVSSFPRPAPSGSPEPPPTPSTSPHPGGTPGAPEAPADAEWVPGAARRAGASCEAPCGAQAGFQKAERLRITLEGCLGLLPRGALCSHSRSLRRRH